MNTVGIKTASELARRLGVTSTTISEYFRESNPKQPSRDTLEKMADVLQVSTDYLLGKEDRPGQAPPQPPATVKLPILGTIRAGMPLIAQENIIGWEEVPSAMVGDEDHFYLIVEGDSMDQADIPPGARVLVNRQVPATNDDIVVVIIDDENATLKKIRYTNGHVELIPESSNPRHKKQVFEPRDIRVLGVVEKVVIDKRRLT